MANESKFEKRLHVIPEKYRAILESFYRSYLQEILAAGYPKELCDKTFLTFLDLVSEQIKEPHPFASYHMRIREPFDYYAFGLDFLRPLVDPQISEALGMDYAGEIDLLVSHGSNVILLANHQIEADPLAIRLLLEKSYPKLAEEMIFVAGERVLTDPLAIPFSLGCNLLCIYSKRYIDHPPEQKTHKQLHNKTTMSKMAELLSEGGKCIYVAPSGGRDRPNSQDIVEVAPFDPQSIEMFYLMAQKATRPTFFYTLALKTYSILPPPETIQVELGETRKTKRDGIKLCFGQKVNMEHYEGFELADKHERRAMRAKQIWQQVINDYHRL